MRLELGHVYELDGRPWKCARVNECRALLVPAWKERATFTDSQQREDRSFEYTPSRQLSVSPNAILPEWRP